MTLDNRIDGAVLVIMDIDALKRSEQDAETARNYAVSIVRTLRDPLLVLRADLRVSTANEAFYETFDVKPEDTEGRLIYELGNGQWNIPGLRTLLEEILPTKNHFNDFEVTHEFPTLGRRTMLLNARRLNVGLGGRESVVLVIEDVSERKRAEEAVRESSEKYRTLFASIDEGFCVIEKVEGEADEPIDFRYVEANPAFAEQSGVSGVVGKTIRQAFPGESEAWFETYDTLLRTGEPIRFERGLVTHGRVLELYAFRVEDETHRRVAVIFKDISERKLTEEALRHSAERMRFMAQSIPQKVFTTDASGDADYFNSQWTEYAGLSFTQMKDRGWMQLIHRGDAVESDRLWKHSIATGEPFEREHRLRRADGEYRWHLSRTLALKDAGGRILMWVGSSIDIHDFKESDRHKDEFLAMLAHELRNPLTPIRNAVQILRRMGGDSTQGQLAIDMMDRQLEQVVRLVDDLLDVSRISRGKIGLRAERTELASVLNHAVEAAQSLCESAGNELTVALPPQPIYVNGDPIRLAQIVGNLLHNACKFTERGGRIALMLERDGGQAVIRVRDTGIGIGPELLPRIFDLFMQADSSMGRAQDGLGIGLTLVKSLVELHDGTIEARSGGIGQGAEMVVRLPISNASIQVPSQVQFGDEAATAIPRRILIVDDNHDIAESLATLLTLGGHDVHIAHDGLAAVEAAAKLQPDIIFLDIGLPKLDGYEAGRRIRQQRGDKRLLLVALTGWGRDEERHRSQQAGFDHHMVKPVDIAAIEKLLASMAFPAT